MTKIDLKKSSGFPVELEDSQLHFKEFQADAVNVCNVEDIKEQLLNKDISSPEPLYKKYCKIDHDNILKDKNIQLNIYVIASNLAGIEHIKTKANKSDRNRLIEILYGGGLLLIQDFKESVEGKISYSPLKRDQKALIPSNYESCIYNTKTTPLVIAEYIVNGSNTQECLDDMGGMSYYVIRKNAKYEIVRNPVYRLANKVKKVNFDKLLLSLGVTSKTPLIKQILRKYEKFDWFFNTADINI